MYFAWPFSTSQVKRWWYYSILCRHNGCDGVSNHQPRHCLLNHLFRRRSKKQQSSASLAFMRGIHRWTMNSPHKWPVAQKMIPFNDVIMSSTDDGHHTLLCVRTSWSIVVVPRRQISEHSKFQKLCTLLVLSRGYWYRWYFSKFYQVLDNRIHRHWTIIYIYIYTYT